MVLSVMRLVLVAPPPVGSSKSTSNDSLSGKILETPTKCGIRCSELPCSMAEKVRGRLTYFSSVMNHKNLPELQVSLLLPSPLSTSPFGISSARFAVNLSTK